MRFVIALCAFAVFSTGAHADYSWPSVDLACSKTDDVALIRSTIGWDEYPPAYSVLPDRVDGGLSKEPGKDRTDCRLKNGWTIRIRSGQKQAFAYGMGGADPPAFFSLWIDKRHVLSRYPWKPGYAEDVNHPRMLVGLVVRPQTLTYCTIDYNDSSEHPAVACKDEPFDLKKYAVDLVEYPAGTAKRLPAGTAYFSASAADRSLCEAELPRIDFGTVDMKSRDDLDAELQLSPASGDRNSPVLTLDGSYPDLAGKHVWIVHGENHYYDGDMVVVAPSDTADAAIAAQFPADDPEAEAVQSIPAGWSVIAGGRSELYPDVSTRYVHFDPLKIGGDLYFLAHPANIEELPAAILVKPLATGGFNKVCTFNVVEPHY